MVTVWCICTQGIYCITGCVCDMVYMFVVVCGWYVCVVLYSVVVVWWGVCVCVVYVIVCVGGHIKLHYR